MMSTGMKLPRQNILVSIQERERNEQTLPTLQILERLGYTLYATPKTAEFLEASGVTVTRLAYADQVEAGADNCIDDYISRGDIHLVLMFSNQYSVRTIPNYAIRRLAVDYGVPLMTNIQVAQMFAESLEAAGAKATGSAANTVLLDPRSLHEWYE